MESNNNHKSVLDCSYTLSSLQRHNGDDEPYDTYISLEYIRSLVICSDAPLCEAVSIAPSRATH